MSGRIAIDAPSYAQLDGASRPTSGQPETLPWVFYDTQTYTDNSTAQLTFFGAAQSDAALSNIGVGRLQTGQYFRPFRLKIDVIPSSGFVTTAAGGVAGAIDDLGLLLVTGRPRVELNYGGKRYGPFPALYFEGSGKIDGFGWGTFTAEESLQYASNHVGDPGGAYLCGGITFEPNREWTVVMTWPAAVNITADYRIRVGLVGSLSRPVL